MNRLLIAVPAVLLAMCLAPLPILPLNTAAG